MNRKVVKISTAVATLFTLIGCMESKEADSCFNPNVFDGKHKYHFTEFSIEPTGRNANFQNKNTSVVEVPLSEDEGTLHFMVADAKSKTYGTWGLSVYDKDYPNGFIFNVSDTLNIEADFSLKQNESRVIQKITGTWIDKKNPEYDLSPQILTNKTITYLGIENLTVPSGEFTTCKFSVSFEQEDGNIVQSFLWYAQKAGHLVQLQDPDSVVMLERVERVERVENAS